MDIIIEAVGPLLASLLSLVLNPQVLITSLAIGTLLEIVKPLINAKPGDKGWRGVFYITMPAHAVLLGSLLGCIPWLPPLDSLVKPGYEGVGRFSTYLLAGIVCKLGYDSFIATTKRGWALINARISGLIRTYMPSVAPPPPSQSNSSSEPSEPSDS